MAALAEGEFAKLPEYLRAHLECSICFLIGTDWRVLPCQHAFCRDCIDRLDHIVCPTCRHPCSKEDMKPFLNLNQLAAQLPVYCGEVGRRSGCPWEGPFSHREIHIAECGYHTVPCCYESEGCPERPLRKDAPDHEAACEYRMVVCCHDGCVLQFQARALEGKKSHEAVCGMAPVSCPDCGADTLLGMLPYHRESVCTEAIVTCEKHSLEEITKQAPTHIPMDELLKQVSAFAATCMWTGKRDDLPTHKRTCAAYQLCMSQYHLLSRLYTLESTCVMLQHSHSELQQAYKAATDECTWLKDEYTCLKTEHVALKGKYELLEKEVQGLKDRNMDTSQKEDTLVQVPSHTRAARPFIFPKGRLDTLYLLITEGRYADVRAMLSTGVSLSVNDGTRSALHVCAEHGRMEILRLILDRGAHDGLLDVVDRDGCTVLHRATWHGHVDMIRYIVVEKGHRRLLLRVDNNRHTVLHLAAVRGNMDAIRFLVEETGITDHLSMKDADGRTPLFLARQCCPPRSKREVLEYLGLKAQQAGQQFADDLSLVS
eukprot:Rmarinus@m.25035